MPDNKQKIKKERAWYAIHTYAGYENAVERNLRQRIDSLGVQDLIFDILVPVEKTVKKNVPLASIKASPLYTGIPIVSLAI